MFVIDPAGGVLISALNMVVNLLKFFVPRKSSHAKKLENAEKRESMLIRRLESERTTKIEKEAISRQLKTITFFLTEDIEGVPAELTEIFYKVRLANHALDKNVKDAIKQELQVDCKGFVKKGSYSHSYAGLILGGFILFLAVFMGVHGLYSRTLAASLVGLSAILVAASFLIWALAVLSNIKLFQRAIIRYYNQNTQKAFLALSMQILLVQVNPFIKKAVLEKVCALFASFIINTSPWWLRLRKIIFASNPGH